jgi:predicted nicotinamide N-methyase
MVDTALKMPSQAREIYERLSQKFSLELEPISIRQKRFQFLTLKDIEPLIAGKDIFAESLNFPFWVKIWEASVVMADFFSRIKPDAEKRVLELGAGLGVTGIVAASFGHRVMITDYDDEILDFARCSSYINGCQGVLFSRLDWLEPSDIGKFEIITGSEILFHQSFFEPLLNVFRLCLAKDGVIYMAHDIRRKSLSGFLKLCENDFDIAVQKKKLHSGDDESYEILLTRLIKKV